MPSNEVNAPEGAAKAGPPRLLNSNLLWPYSKTVTPLNQTPIMGVASHHIIILSGWIILEQW
jgi:hypothetical protein